MVLHARRLRCFSFKADGDAVTRSEIEQALDGIGHSLEPLDIVLMRTGRDAFRDRTEGLFWGLGEYHGLG